MPLPPWTHTREDTADKFNWAATRLNVKVFAGLLEEILTCPDLPLRRMSRAELRRMARTAAVASAMEWRLGTREWHDT